MLSSFSARKAVAQRRQVLARRTGWTDGDRTEHKAAGLCPGLSFPLTFPPLVTSARAHGGRGCSQPFLLSQSSQSLSQTYPELQARSGWLRHGQCVCVCVCVCMCVHAHQGSGVKDGNYDNVGGGSREEKTTEIVLRRPEVLKWAMRWGAFLAVRAPRGSVCIRSVHLLPLQRMSSSSSPLPDPQPHPAGSSEPTHHQLTANLASCPRAHLHQGTRAFPSLPCRATSSLSGTSVHHAPARPRGVAGGGGGTAEDPTPRLQAGGAQAR